jgi:hypothetical protein
MVANAGRRKQTGWTLTGISGAVKLSLYHLPKLYLTIVKIAKRTKRKVQL